MAPQLTVTGTPCRKFWWYEKVLWFRHRKLRPKEQASPPVPQHPKINGTDH
ncbi:MAG: hypothetical protein IGS39_18185 [Calothrix sp. C42_A2020_038]|nr:hypothetical protein [Calothrix sp. C42_A2020_038]